MPTDLMLLLIAASWGKAAADAIAGGRSRGAGLDTGPAL
jgi:hypothetical protein